MACIVHRASMCSWFSRPGRLALHARLLSGIPHGRFEAINSSSVPYVAGQFFLHRELGYRGIIGAKLSVRVVEYDTSALPSSILRSEAPPLSATEQSSPPQPGTSSLCQQGVVQDETVSAHVQPHPQSFTPNLSAPTSSTVDDSSCGDVGKKSEERNGKGDPNANLNTREIGGVIDVPSCLYGISEEAWLALNMRPMGGGQRIPHDSVIQHYVPAKVTVEPWYHVRLHSGGCRILVLNPLVRTHSQLSILDSWIIIIIFSLFYAHRYLAISLSLSLLLSSQPRPKMNLNCIDAVPRWIYYNYMIK
eukprot:m.176368 g.176368  ORF g.176368 m.176368 type:complete len:305 (-) comp14627_c0_seq35:1080-1994(-)